MRVRPLAVAVAVLATCTPGVRADSAFEYVLKPYVAASYSTVLNGSQGRIGDEVAEIELTSELGWEIGVEWRFGRFLALEAAYASFEHDLEFGGRKLGTTTFEPLFVSLNWHTLRNDQIDFWLAPTVAFVEFADDGLAQGVEAGGGSETTLGVSLGLDWNFGERMSLTTGLRYFDLQHELGGGEFAIDPLLLRAGLAVRF